MTIRYQPEADDMTARVSAARAHLKTCGMDPVLVDRIPQDTLRFHLSRHVTFDGLWEICEGRPRAVQTGHQESK